MKRLLYILSLVLLFSCENGEIDKCCYTCIRYTTDQIHQRVEFCDKADMDQYLTYMQANPKTVSLHCRTNPFNG